MASVSNIFETILKHLETMAKAETVLGEPGQVGDRTVVPVVKISLGFGAGGNDSTEKEKTMSGGGGGGGLGINPVGFIVIEGDKTAFLPVKLKNVSALTEMIPNIMDKVSDLMQGKKAVIEVEAEEE